ncbi:MAG TPA: polysaccharide biosynthesis/export family protein [Terriglobales bacterium]
MGMRFHKTAITLMALACCAGTVAAQTAHTSKAAPPPVAAKADPPAAQPEAAAASQYTLGAGDVVAVDVWHEPEVSRTLPIRPDGRISLPLAGEVLAKGLTTLQLQDEIADRLKKYIDHPAVTVMLQQAESRRYNILGMVNHPGSVVLTQPTTILDAIAQAGGLRDFAHGNKIYLIRKRASDGVEIRYNFNYDKVSRGLAPQQNIPVQPDDIIVVP